MKEVPIALGLMFVKLRAELNMSLRLTEVLVKLRHPRRVIPVNLFVQFIEHAKISTRWTSDEKKWLVLQHDVPRSLPVKCQIEVKTICQVERATSLQTKLLAESSNALRRVDLHQVYPSQRSDYK